MQKLLDGFANWIGASLTTVWKKDTTHVIISTDEQGICQSTKKVLMAILNGQWVVNFDCTIPSFSLINFIFC